MAVPKKRTSKSKKNLRKTVWKKKTLKAATRAYFAKIKGVLTSDDQSIKSQGFGLQ